MRKYYFYKLYSTKNENEIRYIGVTTKTIQERFYQHRYCANNPKKRNLPVHKWMYSHYTKGYDILCSLIDECFEDEWEIREQTLIHHYKNLGHKLLNLDKGGSGIVTKEQRSKDGIQRSINAHKIPIIALNKDGSKFMEFSSQKEASEYFGLKSKSAINNVLKGRSETCKGYIWVTKENYESNNYSIKITPRKNCIGFNQFDLQGNLMKHYTSKKELLGKSNSSALDKALKNQTIYRNSYWSFKDNINIKI